MRISWLALSVLLSVAFGTRANAVEHPDVQLLNAQGAPVMRLEQASQSRSCGACHDSEHIARSLSLAHQQDSLALTLSNVLRLRQGTRRFADVGDIPCSSCHGSFSAAEKPGFASGKTLGSGRDPRACSACHGELALQTQPPFLPDVDYRPADLAAFTGALLSGQRINSSAMNVHDKASRSDPFDIHLARGLVCTDCHQGENRPGNALRRTSAPPPHLRRDPRDVPLREYLQRPDHSMQTALQCTDCHRADSGHDWLPFTAQHMRRLACESCHITTPLGPALKSIDLVSGERDIRGRDSRGLVFGYAPLLLEMQSRLTPFNLIGVSDGSGADKTNAVLAVPLRHGVVRDGARRNCVDCHSPGGLAQASLSLGTRFSDTAAPILGPAVAHSVSLDVHDGELFARANPDAGGFYLLGADQLSWADRLGMLIASTTLAGVLLHGLARYLAFRRRGASQEPHRRVYMYGVYERFWHWLQATAILGLLITGATIHKPYVFDFLSFAYMIELHNLLGFILLVNAALAAFYHLASGEVKQYLPGTTDLFGRMFLQARYYLQGIFRGDPHPFAKDPEHKLNPLQQITYFGLLNTLLPAQILTGIVIWGAQRWPELATELGGLIFLAPLHSFMAWLFAAFLIMHIYLTTTSGPRPLSGIQAMLEGWEELESPPGGTA